MSLSTERKLINLFKLLVEKTLIPQIKKVDGSLSQWTKFLSLVSADPIKYNEIQLYVDTIPNYNINIQQNSNLNALNIPDKSGYRKREENQSSESLAFNPNKTFGGQRGKLGALISAEDQSELKRESQKDESVKQRNQHNSSNIISSLGRLVFNLEENQKFIEGTKQKASESKNKEEPRVQRESRESKMTPQNTLNRPNINPNNSVNGNRPQLNTSTPTNYGSVNSNFGMPLTPSSNNFNPQTQQGYRSYY